MKDCARMEECGMTTSKQIDSWKSILTMANDPMADKRETTRREKHIKNVD